MLELVNGEQVTPPFADTGWPTGTIANAKAQTQQNCHCPAVSTKATSAALVQRETLHRRSVDLGTPQDSTGTAHGQINHSA